MHTPFAWCPSSKKLLHPTSPDDFGEMFEHAVTAPVEVSQTCYFPSAGVNDTDGAMNSRGLKKIRLRHIRDGASHTLFWSERTPDICPRESVFLQPWCDVMHFIAITGPNRAPSVASGATITECYSYYLDTSSAHSGGANYALGDGAVLFLRDDVDSWHPTDIEVVDGSYLPVPTQLPGVYQALATRAGGETVDITSSE